MTENDLPEELSVSPPGRYRPPGYASADKRRRAIALFEAGIGYTKASRILDLPSTTLRDWAEAWKSGKFSVEISPNLYRYSDAVRTKAIAMRLSGSTWKAIRAATGAPPATVRRWIDAHCAQTQRKPAKPEPLKKKRHDQWWSSSARSPSSAAPTAGSEKRRGNGMRSE